MLYSDNNYALACLHQLLSIEYWKTTIPILYDLLLKEFQCYNEVCCETSISFLASDLHQYPQMTDVSAIDKMWKLNGYNRSSRQILYSFLNISKGKTSINVTNDNKEVVLLYNTIHTLLESLDNDEKCLYPSFTNGNILFILFFLILFLGFIDIPEKIKLRRPSTIDKKN